MKTFIIGLIVLQNVLIIISQELHVTIDQGTVKGHKHETRGVYEFYGIPYAKAPTGSDKFKAPLPADNWEGVLDAVNNLILCPQDIGDFLPISLPYTEDCLIANVYVPENTEILKPVVVYIHGGAFAIGFGSLSYPYNLVERDIVVVNFNYRLGAHGFLCLNTESIPGNAGLKDQLAALKWVKENIEAFGGDPNDITLAGYSAGSGSAELLMLSPAANNLFNKVILESGSAASSWAVNPKAVEQAKHIAARHGVTDVENLDLVHNFYLDLSYEELLALGENAWAHFDFSPCIDKNNTFEEVIIPELPNDVLVSGNYVKIPLLTGYTDAEGLIWYEIREEIMTVMNENFTNALPVNFDSFSEMNEAKAAELINDFYFDENTITDDSLRNFTDYFTDSLFTYSIIESAKLHALNSSVPVYLYEFSYIASAFELDGSPIGAAHCAQTNIIHDILQENMSENDLLVQNRMVDMWTNFIKYGEPVPTESPYDWEPLNPENMNYLVIDLNIQNDNHPLQERLQFWENIWTYNAASNIRIYFSVLLLNCILLIW